MKSNEQRFNTYREETTGDEEDDSSEEESSTSNESSLLKEESGEDSGDNEIDEKDVSKEQDVNKELTSIGMKPEPTGSTRHREKFMTNIIDISFNTNAITLKTVHPNLFRRETTKIRIFIL